MTWKQLYNAVENDKGIDYTVGVNVQDESVTASYKESDKPFINLFTYKVLWANNYYFFEGIIAGKEKLISGVVNQAIKFSTASGCSESIIKINHGLFYTHTGTFIETDRPSDVCFCTES